MNETASTTAETLAGSEVNSAPETTNKQKEEGSFLAFLLKLAIFVLVLRSFIFAPFSIPSESMLPGLQNGDHLFAAKWSYGFSNFSLPFGIEPFAAGRLFASQPERGDIAIFRAPPLNNEDYIKRVIGLPGDQIQMIGGVLHINGVAVRKEAIEDFEIAVSPNTQCASHQYEATRTDGTLVCRYPQYRETLPNGVTYNVLDFGERPQDDTPARIVPQGMVFMMGDNRDNSLDSRFPAQPGRGVGLVPQDNLVGEALVISWSTDGSSAWIKPWTWFSAARWGRIGDTL